MKITTITVLREHIDFNFERKMLKIFSISIVKQFGPLSRTIINEGAWKGYSRAISHPWDIAHWHYGTTNDKNFNKQVFDLWFLGMVEELIAAGFSMQHLSSSYTSHVKDLILKTKPSLFIADLGYSSQTRLNAAWYENFSAVPK